MSDQEQAQALARLHELRERTLELLADAESREAYWIKLVRDIRDEMQGALEELADNSTVMGPKRSRRKKELPIVEKQDDTITLPGTEDKE